MKSFIEGNLFKFILASVTGATTFAMVICGIVGWIKSYSPFLWAEFILCLYIIIFGLVATLNEFLDNKFLLKRYGFFRTHSGRGLFVMFIASLGLAPGQNHKYLLAVGIICGIVGLVQLLLGLTVLGNDVKGSENTSQYKPVKNYSNYEKNETKQTSNFQEKESSESSESSDSSSSGSNKSEAKEGPVENTNLDEKN
eukprot:Anaeramoba_flamelloidesc40880_g1_i2.p1 GENE.c40880_g1_i2~~c40880_g1_i2.p1  ORF type:complete len:207 (-),score=21.18 c40880_g1_i2:127-717(-)